MNFTLLLIIIMEIHSTGFDLVLTDRQTDMATIIRGFFFQFFFVYVNPNPMFERHNRNEISTLIIVQIVSYCYLRPYLTAQGRQAMNVQRNTEVRSRIH